MAGIGEASAILGVAQIGLSLAITLNTYISDIGDAKDDILSLIGDIEATSRQLGDLELLIQKNEVTHAWNENGLRNAQKCITDCEKIIAKLRSLLKKSKTSKLSGEVKREEIDIGKLQQALWPLYKPQLQVRRRELQSVKQDILIAYASYQVKAGTDAERKKYSDDLPRLQRTRQLVRKQVREAKERRARHESGPRVKFKSNVPASAKWARQDRDRGYRRSADRRDSDDESFYFDNEDDLFEAFEQWRAEEDDEKKMEEAKKKQIEDEAIENFKQQQTLALETRRRKIENERTKLRAELIKARIPPQQIEEIVSRTHPLEDVSNEMRILSAAFGERVTTDATPAQVPTEVSKQSSNRRWPFWRKGSKVSNSQISQVQAGAIPLLLRDPTSEGGIAPLEACLFHRTNLFYRVMENVKFDIPDQWLLRSIIEKQENLARNPSNTNSVWREFSLLPEDYRDEITAHIRRKNRLSEPSRWVLLHIEPLHDKRERGIFRRLQSQQPDVLGVYVILKETRRPGVRPRDEVRDTPDARISTFPPYEEVTPLDIRSRPQPFSRGPIIPDIRPQAYPVGPEPRSFRYQDDFAENDFYSRAPERPSSPRKSKFEKDIYVPPYGDYRVWEKRYPEPAPAPVGVDMPNPVRGDSGHSQRARYMADILDLRRRWDNPSDDNDFPWARRRSRATRPVKSSYDLKKPSRFAGWRPSTNILGDRSYISDSPVSVSDDDDDQDVDGHDRDGPAETDDQIRQRLLDEYVNRSGERLVNGTASRRDHELEEGSVQENSDGDDSGDGDDGDEDL